MHSGHKVYIIGFMGSGKTTAGRKLSKALGWSFADIDQLIELVEKKTIGTIFSECGEAHFRKIESEYLRKFEKESNIVISTGGGAPCFLDNLGYMKNTGLVVYLKMNPVDIAERLEGEQDTRPLVKGLNRKELNSYIESKLREREPFYKQADIVENGMEPDIHSLADKIKKLLK